MALLGLKLTSGQISTAIGSCLLHITAGIAAIWGSTNIYYLSYFHSQDYTIDNDTNSQILISIIIPISIILVLSTKICDKLGYTRTIKLCSLIFFASQFILYLKFTLVLLTIFTLIIPVACITVSLIPAINLFWSHFMQQKSICTALTLVFLGLGTIMWNVTFTEIVNPQNQEAEIDENGTAYFSQNVTSKVEKATKIIMFICSIIYLIGASLIKESPLSESVNPPIEPQVKKKAQVQQNKFSEDIDKERKSCERHGLTHKGSEAAIEQEENDKKAGKEKVTKNKSLKLQGKQESQQKQLLNALSDSKCLFIFALLIVIDIYPTYLLNNFKVIYMPIFNDDRFLAACIVTNTVANIFGTFIWGFLAHKIGNITTVGIVGAITLIGGILGIFSKNHIIVLIFMFVFGVGDRGMQTLAGPTFAEIYGLRTATLLLPYKGLSLIIGFSLAPIFQLMTAKFLNPFQQLNFFFIFCIISFLIGLYYSKKYNQFDKKREDKSRKVSDPRRDEMMQYQQFQGEMQVQSKITES